MPVKSVHEEVHPLDQCEEAVRSIAIVLSHGNYEGAKNRLAAVIKDLNPTDDGRTAIADALGVRIANMIETNFGILFLEDMTKVSINQLLSVRSSSYTTVQKIETALRRRGISLRNPIMEPENTTDD